MAKNSKNVQRRKNIKNKNRRRRARNVTIGNIVASGAKTLISSIPVIGDVLKNILDFRFKNYNLTSTDYPFLKLGDTFKLEEKQTLTSLTAKFSVYPVAILCGSRGCIMKNDKTIISQYLDGRISSITIKIIPSGSYKDRAGDWHLGFQPFFNEQDLNTADIKDTSASTELGIHHMFLSTSGPANRTLSLTYRPRVVDGRAFQFIPLNQPYGMVSIRYDHYNRASYVADISPEEFACDTKISGTVITRMTGPQASGVHEFSVFVDDKYKGVDSFVRTPNGTVITLSNEEVFIEGERNRNFKKVLAITNSPSKEISLDDMCM